MMLRNARHSLDQCLKMVTIVNGMYDNHAVRTIVHSVMQKGEKRPGRNLYIDLEHI
jgi:hypothetical protein